jgi:excisionase family DNA binding protein
MSSIDQVSATVAPPTVNASSSPPTVSPSVEERVYHQLFDRESLSDYLRISTDTIDRLVKAGKLRCIRIGSQVRFTLDDVDAFINRHRAPAGEPR